MKFKVTIQYADGDVESFYAQGTGRAAGNFITWEVPESTRGETRYITISCYSIRRIEEI
jgi:hypothetical protein